MPPLLFSCLLRKLPFKHGPGGTGHPHGPVLPAQLPLGRPEVSPPREVRLEGSFFPVQLVSVGNPHAVVFCGDPDAIDQIRPSPPTPKCRSDSRTARAVFDRSSDITDLITNVAGGVLGYGLYVMFKPVTFWILAQLKKPH